MKSKIKEVLPYGLVGWLCWRPALAGSIISWTILSSGIGERFLGVLGVWTGVLTEVCTIFSVADAKQDTPYWMMKEWLIVNERMRSTMCKLCKQNHCTVFKKMYNMGANPKKIQASKVLHTYIQREVKIQLFTLSNSLSDCVETRDQIFRKAQSVWWFTSVKHMISPHPCCDPLKKFY